MRNYVFICVLLFSACNVKTYQWVSPPDFERLAPFMGTVDKVYISKYKDVGDIVSIDLALDSGKRIAMADTAASATFSAFARTLTTGKRYEFPTIWLEFKKRNSGAQNGSGNLGKDSL